MSVLTVTITDPVFDKKSSEAAYLAHVLELVATKLRNQQGAISSATNVLGTSSTGVANTVVATFTHTPSGSNP
jgi:hypothetical protein